MFASVPRPGGLELCLWLCEYVITSYSIHYTKLYELRAVIGGRFEFTVSGGGALPPHIDCFFNYIGIKVLEGYGMTESSPVLSVRLLEKLVIGTVGPMWPDTQLRIVDPETKEVFYPNSKYPHEGLV